MQSKAIQTLLGKVTHRAFGTYAAHQSAGSSFTRADLGEFPELNRSFMKVLDSGIDT